MSDNHPRQVLAEYVASGEQDRVLGEHWQHVRDCPICQRDLQRLRRVEVALRQWPMVSVPAMLNERLLAAARLPRSLEENYPRWTIWLPAVTVVIAIALALLLAPASLHVALNAPPQAAEPSLSFFALDREAGLALWIGMCVALAGIGVTMGLADSRMPDREDLDVLRTRASRAVEHAWRVATHSR
ncbi:MAG: hypothetical protein ACOX2L_06480 [Anaerolineae bacterium]|jgi:hypothetical protein|nr:hypothetical protein [Chloroflexota bacterium]